MGALSSLLGCSDPDEQQCRQLADWVAEQMKQTKGNFASVLQVVRGLIDNQVRMHVLHALKVTRDLRN
jgi:hypothetical protein